jgi:hypothetical protein
MTLGCSFTNMTWDQIVVQQWESLNSTVAQQVPTMEPLVPLLRKTRQIDTDGPIRCFSLTPEREKCLKIVVRYLFWLSECKNMLDRIPPDSEHWSPANICKAIQTQRWWVALMMEAVSTFETLVNFYQITRRNIPEDSHLHNRHHENMKSHHTFLYSARNLQWFINRTVIFRLSKHVCNKHNRVTKCKTI